MKKLKIDPVSAAVLGMAALALLLSAAAYWRAAAGAQSPPQKEAAGGPAQVVYHADFADPRRFSAMLTNINNMVTTYQNDLRDYDVRIVFVSHGIRFVTEDRLLGTPFAEDPEYRKRRGDLQARLFSLRDVQGVKLELCGITKQAARLADDKLVPGVTVVPSGVVRLVELQQQGFAYIKVE